MSNPKYEYRVTYANDETATANEHMKQWADAGWELVSGSSYAWESTLGGLSNHMTFVMLLA
jgi:hypothetical protein